MIVDTSALYAYFNKDDREHEATTVALESSSEPLIVSPYVVAELDYLLLTRYGTRAEHDALAQLASGAWVLAQVDLPALRDIVGVVERYADIPIGATDASNIVLAERHGTRTIATLDRRHFSVLRFSDGTAPQIVP